MIRIQNRFIANKKSTKNHVQPMLLTLDPLTFPSQCLKHWCSLVKQVKQHSDCIQNYTYLTKNIYKNNKKVTLSYTWYLLTTKLAAYQVSQKFQLHFLTTFRPKSEHATNFHNKLARVNLLVYSLNGFCIFCSINSCLGQKTKARTKEKAKPTIPLNG